MGDVNFCPSCGFKIKEPTVTVTIAKQIAMYLLSFFLPPLGLIPGIKYIRFGDDTAKKVGIALIIITIISTAISIWLYLGFINRVNELINQQLSSPYLQY